MTMKTIFGIVWDFYDTRAKLIPLKQSQGLNQYFCITIMDFLCLYYDRIVLAGVVSAKDPRRRDWISDSRERTCTIYRCMDPSKSLSWGHKQYTGVCQGMKISY